MRILEAFYSNADRSPFVGSGYRSFMVSRRQLARLDGSIPAADRERMDCVVLVIDPKSNAIIRYCMLTVRTAVAIGGNVMAVAIGHVVGDGCISIRGPVSRLIKELDFLQTQRITQT